MFKRATFAVSILPAVLIAGPDDEGMEFIVMLSKFAATRAAHARNSVPRIGRSAFDGE